MSQTTPTPQLTEVQGEPVGPLDEFWLDTARAATKESVQALEEAAKQLISVTTLSQVIYFAAISFGDVRKALGQLEYWQQLLVTVLLVAPLVFWIASLFYAMQVFKPRTYATNLESPDLARQAHQELVVYKREQLDRAHDALTLGFVPLIVNIWMVLMVFRS